MLGVKAIIASNKTKEDIKNKLYTVNKTYQGVSGNVTFDMGVYIRKLFSNKSLMEKLLTTTINFFFFLFFCKFNIKCYK